MNVNVLTLSLFRRKIYTDEGRCIPALEFKRLWPKLQELKQIKNPRALFIGEVRGGWRDSRTSFCYYEVYYYHPKRQLFVDCDVFTYENVLRIAKQLGLKEIHDQASELPRTQVPSSGQGPRPAA